MLCYDYILKILSGATAGNCEWKRLSEISFESQDVLAEMNATLGSLQQWQKHREVNAVATNPGERTLENTLGTSCSGPTEPRSTFLGGNGDADEEDPLFELWQVITSYSDCLNIEYVKYGWINLHRTLKSTGLLELDSKAVALRPDVLT